jgi:hypothetical protein
VTLDPRPIGWFAIARSDELRRGEWQGGVLAAAPYRVRRSRAGALEHEGAIVELAEQNGFVFAWHHPRRRPPSWRVPVLDERGWRPLRRVAMHARTHPQEVYENSIDVGHFPVIHGYSDIAVLAPMRTAGHEMDVSYQIARRLPIPFVERKLVARFQVRLHGIGVAHNHIHVPALDLSTRMLALATPTEPGHVDIRLAVSIARSGAIARLCAPLVHDGVLRSIVNDFRQDVAIWEHKRYLRPPLLVKGDGPIASFRSFCQQFYEGAAA